MASNEDRLSRLFTSFRQQELVRQTKREKEDKATLKMRGPKLRALRTQLEKDEKKLIEEFEKQDQTRTRARYLEDLKYRDALLDEVSVLSNPNDTTTENRSPEIPKTPKNPTNHGGKNRALFEELPSPPQTLTPFELRRQKNMADNEAMLKSIAPLLTPPRLQRSVNAAKKLDTPTVPVLSTRRSTRSTQECGSADPTDNLLHNDDPFRTDVPISSSPHQLEKQITMMGMESRPGDDVLAESPEFSQQFYFLECAQCHERFGNADAMAIHLRQSGHMRVLGEEQLYENINTVCGVKVAGPAPKWVARRRDSMIATTGNLLSMTEMAGYKCKDEQMDVELWGRGHNQDVEQIGTTELDLSDEIQEVGKEDFEMAQKARLEKLNGLEDTIYVED